MEDRDDRPEAYTIDPGSDGHLGDVGDEPEGDHDPAGADSAPAGVYSRRPMHARARIEGVEAGVAAGLVPAAGGEEGDPAFADWMPDPGASDPLDPEAARPWEELDDSLPATAGEATSPALPDWRDPPTREVPRVLLEDPLAEPAPSYPGPVWREVEADWDDDDLTFAEIVQEGTSVADHGLSINEPDPFAFDEIGPVTSTGRQLEVAPEEEGAPEEEEEGWEASSEPVYERESVSGVEESPPEPPSVEEEEPTPPARASAPRRARRGTHRARASAAGGARHERQPRPPAASAAPTLPAHAASAATAPASSRRNPVIATLTGLAVGAAVVLIFLAGSSAVLALVTVVLVVSAAECYQAMRRARYRPAVLLGLLAVAAVSVAGYLKGSQAILLVGASLVIATLCWYVFGISRRSPVANFAATVMGWAWIGLLGSFASLLIDPRAFPHRHGLAYLFGAIVATVSYDVGGYAFGSWIGKRPLAPSISPNKTVEGLAGGCFAAVALSVAVVSHLHPWTVPHALELGLVVAVFAPLGDLAESMIKRDIGVKDMGTLLPAHGGLLDRIDALLFVLPATYCLVRLIHG